MRPSPERQAGCSAGVLRVPVAPPPAVHPSDGAVLGDVRCCYSHIGTVLIGCRELHGFSG